MLIWWVVKKKVLINKVECLDYVKYIDVVSGFIWFVGFERFFEDWIIGKMVDNIDIC